MSDSNTSVMASEAFIQAGSEFGLSLLREAVGNGTASAILSPVSIAFALSLAYAGAGGSTRKQYDAVFAKNGQSNADVNAFFAQSFKTFNSENKNVTLDIANRAYVDQTLDVKQDYKNTLAQKLGGEFAFVNFGDSAAAAKEINEFVQRTTRQKIKQLVDASSIDAQTRLFLVNAVYFKGAWSKPFNEEATEDAQFAVTEEENKTVKMMYKSFKTPYAANDDVQMVVLPYTDANSQLVVYLPKQKHGLSQWLNKVTGAQLLELRKSAKVESGDINLQLPRFKIEKKLELAQTLQKLGFSEAFGGNADFKGIADTQPPLKIGGVVHKAFVEACSPTNWAIAAIEYLQVNEKGSEAAAATGIEIMPMAFFEPTDFIANHPFLFAITYDNQFLFLGTYAGSD